MPILYNDGPGVDNPAFVRLLAYLLHKGQDVGRCKEYRWRRWSEDERGGQGVGAALRQVGLQRNRGFGLQWLQIQGRGL